MQESASLTPMFRQYREMKQAHPGAILLFRMGDFYEMFYDDANEASRILELTLTARGKGTAHVAPMCGFPHHQIDAYTAKLVRAGRRVAVCDQVEDPKAAKGLVRREVTRVVTPGTITDPEQLDAKADAWVASTAVVGDTIGAAFLDASTGEFLAWQAPEGSDPWDALAERLEAFAPREIVHADSMAWRDGPAKDAAAPAVRTPVEPYSFDPLAAEELLSRHFDVASLDGYGLRGKAAAIAAAGGLLRYLQDTQRSGLQHVASLTLHEPSRFLLLDPSTRRNLEIETSLRDGGRPGSLLHVLDQTVTSPGARLLRKWLLAPLLDPAAIAMRHDAVGEMLSRVEMRLEARQRLQGMHDVERLLGRTVSGAATPRDLVSLRASLERLPALVRSLETARSSSVRSLVDGLDPCEDLASRLSAALVDSPPLSLREGGVVRDGFDPELDELRSIRRDARGAIAAIEARERERSGIPSLKVRYNKVFGYYIEVSRANLERVPDDYHRKQTVANAERFVTPELKEFETKVLEAQERIEGLEWEIFSSLRAEIAGQAPRIQAAARAAAAIDVLASLGETASARGYCRPAVHGGTTLRITAGRHPVVEQTLRDGRFHPNDTHLEPPDPALAILTGPNMGGKSTYLRQVALIVLLAQAGSFVPAEEAEIGLVDRIFCRVGASDSLAEGQSTFMVEMTETANILHHATPRSLVLLDEIGRGTSTFDGLAIAWSVVENLHGAPGGTPRTLFATHYHELTELAVTLSGVVNYRMAVKEWGDRVVFTHRVEPGAADRSYGIHVARLAGVPQPVLERAKEILGNLERDEFGGDGLPRRARRARGPLPRRRPETPLFALLEAREARGAPEPVDPAAAEVLSELRQKDAERLTPLEALQLLHAWTRRLRGEGGGNG